MKASLIGTLLGLLALAIIGCADSAKTPHASTGQGGHEVAEDDVASNLAKLGEDARKLAEAQKFCAIETENRLGSMGPPLKLDVKGEVVFVCCKGCQKKALAHADETLATVAKLKESAAKSESSSATRD